MRRSACGWLLSLLVVSAIGIGCSDGESNNGSFGVRPIVSDKAFVASAAQADQASVEPGQLVFPASGNDDLLERQPGDILVSQRSTAAGSKNPHGFLRKVKAVSKTGDTIVVTTEFASLEDAIVQGRTSTVITAQSLKTQESGGLLGGQVDVSGKVIDNVSLGVKAKVTQGYVHFTPQFDIGIQFGFMSVKEFHAIATGKLEAGLAVEVSSSLAVSAPFVDLTVYESPPYVLPPQFIGPIPIEETVRFSVKLKCELTDSAEFSVEAGASATSTTSIGARYQNGDWTKVASQSFAWQPIGPNLKGKVGGEVKCSLQPELALMFYDVAGPTISVGPYVSLGLAVPPCEWELKAGVEGSVGGEISILGKTIKECSVKVFDESWSIAKGDCEPKDAGADSETGCNKDLTPPAAWTCAAGKYGDCTCDCSCGAPDPDCDQTGQCADCSHDVCTTGTALKPSCNSCTAAVCAKDTYCCNFGWSGSCVMNVEQYCGQTCP